MYDKDFLESVSIFETKCLHNFRGGNAQIWCPCVALSNPIPYIPSKTWQSFLTCFMSRTIDHTKHNTVYEISLDIVVIDNAYDHD